MSNNAIANVNVEFDQPNWQLELLHDAAEDMQNNSSADFSVDVALANEESQSSVEETAQDDETCPEIEEDDFRRYVDSLEFPAELYEHLVIDAATLLRLLDDSEADECARNCLAHIQLTEQWPMLSSHSA